jgi:hypothetical protein
MAGAQPKASTATSLSIVFLALACSCKTIVVHYEWSADRRHLVRVIEEGIDQFVERDGAAEPSYRAIGVESLVLSPDGAHLAYPGMTASGWEVVHDGRRSRPWRGIGQIVLSRDGMHLAYAALDDEGWRVVRDGALGPIVDAIMSNTISFSPDGRRLAWVGQRAGLSYLFLDDRTYGGFSLIGRPTFSGDSRRFAFVAARGRSLRATVDGEQQPQFEEIVELAFSEDGERVGYFGLRNHRWHAVVDGQVGPPFELLASLRFGGGRAAYLAKEGDRWHLMVDGARVATHDEIAHRTLCFTGSEPRYAARDGAVWSAGGPALDSIDALVCRGARWAYVGRSGDRAVVMEGEREVGRYARADAPVFSHDGRLAFIAVDREAFVQIDDRRHAVKLPLLGTLVLSPDGRHFALLCADREARRLHLYVDGAKVQAYDFEETAALAIKRPGAVEEDALSRWVAAELAKHVAGREER